MNQFDIVMLNRDFQEIGLFKWQIGAILEVYDKHNFEVEFSDENGITMYLGAFSSDCLELIWLNVDNQYVGRFGKLLEIFKEVRKIIDSPNTDVTWTKYCTTQEFLVQFDTIINDFKRGKAGAVDKLKLLFAPTGVLQEISLSSGWGDEFIKLSSEFDNIIK